MKNWDLNFTLFLLPRDLIKYSFVSYFFYLLLLLEIWWVCAAATYLHDLKWSHTTERCRAMRTNKSKEIAIRQKRNYIKGKKGYQPRKASSQKNKLRIKKSNLEWRIHTTQQDQAPSKQNINTRHMNISSCLPLTKVAERKWEKNG